MNEDFERSSILTNGYFYTCRYDPTTTVPGYDRNPFLFVLGPAKNPNNVVAFNFAHVASVKDRIQILLLMNSLGDIEHQDVGIPMLTEDVMRRKFPWAKDAIRVYSRKNFKNLYRIKSNCVGKYIEYTGDIMMKEPSEIMNQYWLNYNSNTVPQEEEQLTK